MGRFEGLVWKVASLKNQRDMEHVVTRGLKLSEETGELAADILQVAAFGSPSPKGKTNETILEEACDAFLMALDIALHNFDGENLNEHQRIDRFSEMCWKKMGKWEKQQNSGTDPTQILKVVKDSGYTGKPAKG